MNIGCSWSGGKDSCYALMKALQDGHTLHAIVNMMNENGKVSRSHGLPLSILEQQARAMQVPLIAQPTSWNEYQMHFVESLNKAREDFHVEAMVFGDIDLQQHRDWEEMVCSKSNLQALLPIWKGERASLVKEMLDSGMEVMIVSCNPHMGERFLGEKLTPGLIGELELMDVDVCGENGEFHTVVVKCPIFKSSIKLPDYSNIMHDNYWFLEWHL
jgi:uncharacterized protein (TIGR00290 family)